jgi:Tfp pilus assembly protein PilV
VGIGGFCLTPVIACLFFVTGVLSMLEMQVETCNLNNKRMRHLVKCSMCSKEGAEKVFVRRIKRKDE